jgi:Pyruvate/2-oxoacid:ferredoxin oxidoreductase delta subunit
MRVLPIEAAVPYKSHILSCEAVSNLINTSGTIAVYNCGCRIAERNCDAPIEACFVFGSTADFLIERSFARKITPEEAMRILNVTEKYGLVHMANNSADKAVTVCNCCSCCCLFLRGLLEFGNPHAIAASSYVASITEDLCINCGICSEGRCPVGAIMADDGKTRVLADKCLGCGLCVSICPTYAIELISREVPPQTPPTLQDMALKILTDKGKLDAFMEIMMK